MTNGPVREALRCIGKLGAVSRSHTERVGVIARIRALAVGIAQAWIDQQRTSAEVPAEAEPEKKTKSDRKKAKQFA